MPYNPYFPLFSQNNSNQNNGRIYVQGEAGARAFLVAPNNIVDLWDSDAQVIYIKSADASGRPSMKILDYTIREDTTTKPQTAPQSEFATKDDILSIEKRLSLLEDKNERRNRYDKHEQRTDGRSTKNKE